MNITTNVSKIIHAAKISASPLMGDVMPIHLLYGISVVEGCLAAKMLSSVGVTKQMIERVGTVPVPDMNLNMEFVVRPT